MQNYLSRRAAAITPYTAGEQPDKPNIIKLNTNENPYPPSPRAMEALARFDAATLRLYPRPDGGALRSAAAQMHGLPVSHVFCGNGSDEVLGLSFAAFFDGGIVFPDVTYSFYPVWGAAFRHRIPRSRGPQRFFDPGGSALRKRRGARQPQRANGHCAGP